MLCFPGLECKNRQCKNTSLFVGLSMPSVHLVAAKVRAGLDAEAQTSGGFAPRWLSEQVS